MRKLLVFLIFAFGWLLSETAFSFEYIDFSNSTPEQKEEELKKIGEQLPVLFREKSIEKKQADIAFADYKANLRNLLLYSSRLANYYNYEELLEFLKINTRLGTLKEQDWTEAERINYANNKYKQTKKNVEAEIATYEDFIDISLDACLARNNDFFFKTKVVNEEEYQLKMEEFFQSKVYKDYISSKDSLQKMKPKLVAKIDEVIAVWEKADTTNPEAPIIAQEIVNKL